PPVCSSSTTPTFTPHAYPTRRSSDLPAFWQGTVLILLFSIHLGWMPSLQWVPFTHRPATNLLTMALPALTLGTATAAMITRMSADRKSTRLNSSHVSISYAVFCLTKNTAAIQQHAEIMTHCPSASPSELRASFYQPLVSMTRPGLDLVLLSITRPSSNETAVHIAR